MIYAHKPGDSEPSYILPGHESNVFSPLQNVSNSGLCVGRWCGRNNYFRKLGQAWPFLLDNADNSTARVWKNWQCVYTLKGHERAVWAVLALQNDEYLTGYRSISNLTVASADKTIRYWQGPKLIRTFRKHTDVVRGLCELPGLGFASCGNDAYVLLMSIWL